MDTTTSVAVIETVVEDLDALKYDVGELKDLLNNNKGEINHVRRIVLACERDMEDFTAAMDAERGPGRDAGTCGCDPLHHHFSAACGGDDDGGDLDDAARHWRHPGGLEEPRLVDGGCVEHAPAD